MISIVYYTLLFPFFYSCFIFVQYLEIFSDILEYI